MDDSCAQGCAISEPCWPTAQGGEMSLSGGNDERNPPDAEIVANSL